MTLSNAAVRSRLARPRSIWQSQPNSQNRQRVLLSDLPVLTMYAENDAQMVEVPHWLRPDRQAEGDDDPQA